MFLFPDKPSEFLRMPHSRAVMRGNTNPCASCEYCDDSCDVCLHQPYEHSDSSYYCEPSSCDESEHGDASSEVDSDSDEAGSWFTTPWSKLIAQRVAGYEIDPEIGVQLTPIEDHKVEEDEQQEQKEKEGKHRRKKEQRTGEEQQEQKTEHRTKRRRRLRRRGTRQNLVVVEEALKAAANDEAPSQEVQGSSVGGEEIQHASANDEVRSPDVEVGPVGVAVAKEARSRDTQSTVPGVEIQRSSANDEVRSPDLEVGPVGDEDAAQPVAKEARSRDTQSTVPSVEIQRSSANDEVRSPDVEASGARGNDAQQPVANSEVRPGAAEGTEQRANDEALAEYIESVARAAKTEVQGEGELVPKDALDSTWRQAVQSCVPQVSAS